MSDVHYHVISATPNDSNISEKAKQVITLIIQLIRELYSSLDLVYTSRGHIHTWCCHGYQSKAIEKPIGFSKRVISFGMEELVKCGWRQRGGAFVTNLLFARVEKVSNNDKIFLNVTSITLLYIINLVL